MKHSKIIIFKVIIYSSNKTNVYLLKLKSVCVKQYKNKLCLMYMSTLMCKQ